MPVTRIRIASAAIFFIAIATASLAPGQALRTATVADGLENPWAVAFLPQGRYLVTERPGRLRVVEPDGTLSAPVAGLPAVQAGGQGGLLDLVLDTGFERNRTLYFCFSEPGPGGNSTALARARLSADRSRLEDVTRLFSQQPKVASSLHFGCRIVEARDGTLLLALGERYHRMQDAQRLDNHHGKVVRLNKDGSVPRDNPFVGRAGALPEIWSYGHRNPQGAALHPATGELWLVEHGPQGGDELNRVRPGRNHGWPLRSYGCPYGAPVGEACRVGGGRHAPEFEEPVATWVPTSIAPSDLLFYTGRLFAGWQSPGTGPGQVSALIPSLAGAALWRVVIGGPPEAPREVARERLLADLGERLRCLRQASDGALLLLTDSGKLLRVTPR